MAARIKIGVVNLPNPNAVRNWIRGIPKISPEESPRDIKEFYFMDSPSLDTANFIKIEENTPNFILFDTKVGDRFLENPDYQDAILGFIRGCQDQFKIQKGENVVPWRDIPCRLNIFEQAKVTDEWCQSMFSWISPKCNKCGFHCQAHALRQKTEFVTTVENSNGRRIGYIRVLDA